MIVFFVVMQFRRNFKFKTQRRWLNEYPELWAVLGFSCLPHRTTLSLRYKKLYETLQQFIVFVGQYASELSESFSQAHLVEDKSLFQALGPIWHQKYQQAGYIPKKLRHLNTDASWGKSGYQGWVYGYGLHLTCNQAAFPQLIDVKTGSVSEKEVFASKELFILDSLQPLTLAADNSYTQVSRIRRWAKQGVTLLTPAKKWTQGRFARAYHRFLQRPAMPLCCDNVGPRLNLYLI